VRNTQAISGGAFPRERDQARFIGKRTLTFSWKEDFKSTTRPVLTQQIPPRADTLCHRVHCLDPAAGNLCQRGVRMTGVGQPNRISYRLLWRVLWPIHDPQIQGWNTDWGVPSLSRASPGLMDGHCEQSTSSREYGSLLHGLTQTCMCMCYSRRSDLILVVQGMLRCIHHDSPKQGPDLGRLVVKRYYM
jgi:hypothetical protein